MKFFKLNYIYYLVLLIGIGNFLLYIGIDMNYGGSAFSGQINKGHYYLANLGVLKETSMAIYELSLLQTRLLFITHPLAILSAWIIINNRPFHKIYI